MRRKLSKGRKKTMPSSAVHKAKLHETEENEIAQLEKKVIDAAPPLGALSKPGQPLPTKFTDLPLSNYTLQGLKRGAFENLTKIQQIAIPHALSGRDVLATAKTGSGKTLAFLIPILERMYRQRWSPEDGVGVVIVSPTRELALQIFEVLRVVGYKQRYTAGLLIGGSKYGKERSKATMINIAVCTPGRFLQHLEQTPYFNVDNVHSLVLDEADRLLDMGFKPQLVQILNHLPKGKDHTGKNIRQTMLFSATQTKSVKSLAKLSLDKPQRVAVHEKSERATPENLAQAYCILELPDKLNVQFIDAAFRRMQPGIPLMCLHGKIKQKRRMHIYYDFVAKPAAVLFATDIVARGLDFPAVDWVVQVDCPEDVDSYIHRVGRTARYKDHGKAFTFLLQNEADGFLPLLEKAKIPIIERKVNPARSQSIEQKLRAELTKDANLKITAQKAFKSYMRSVHLQTNKEIFNVNKLPIGAFARSLGLMSTPRIKVIGEGGEKSRKELRRKKNMPNGLAELISQISGKDQGDEEKQEKNEKDSRRQTKWEKLINRKEIPKAKVEIGNESEEDEEDDGDLLVFKQKLNPLTEEELAKEKDFDTKSFQSERARKRVKISSSGTAKGKVRATKTLFDEETGKAMSAFERMAESFKETESSDKKVAREEYLEDIAKRLKETDKKDREDERERIKTKHREERLKLRAKRRRDAPDSEGAVAMLALPADSRNSDEDDTSGDDTAGSSSDEGEDENDSNVPEQAGELNLEEEALKLISQS